MEWTFSEKLKRICNVLSVAYIVIGCAFYSWVMDVRDAYPVQGYLVDGVLSSIPYIIAAVVIFYFCIQVLCDKSKSCLKYVTLPVCLQLRPDTSRWLSSLSIIWIL